MACGLQFLGLGGLSPLRAEATYSLKQIIHSLSESLQKQIDDLVERLGRLPIAQRIIKRLDWETEERKALGIHTPPGSIFQRFLLATGAALILAFVASQLGYYLDWQKAYENNPKVWNLTRDKIEWNVYYGQSEACGKVPCRLLHPSAKGAKQMVLPAREFPLMNWKRGQKIYLSTELQIPDFLLELKEPLAFYSHYIWAKRYTFYLNDEPFHAGQTESVFITIPQELLTKKLKLAFEIDAGELPFQGLSNKHDLLVGGKRALAGAAYSSTLNLQTVPLWYLLPKFILFVFFLCLYLKFYRYKEIFYLCIFLFLSALSNYFRSGYFPDWIQNQINGHGINALVFSFAQLAFIGFVHEYFRRYSVAFNLLLRTASIVLGLSALGALTNSEVAGLLNQYSFFITASEALAIASFLYGTFLSGFTVFYLRSKQFTGFRAKTALLNYVIFLSLGLGILFLRADEKYILNDSKFLQEVATLILIFSFSSTILIEWALAIPQRNAIRGLFSKFVNQKIMDEALKSENLLKPTRKQITTLVVDIRGFTRFCESESPETVLSTLNQIHSIINLSAHKYFGYVDKYTGDGAMLLFGPLDPHRNHATDALHTAALILSEFKKLQPHSDSLRKLDMGVGISSGEAIVGEVGTQTKSEYTALGNSVNLAFRLQDHTKVLNHALLIDRNTYKALASRILACIFEGQILKNLNSRQEVYAILAYRAEENEWLSLSADYQALSQKYPEPQLLMSDQIESKKSKIQSS